MRIPDIDGLRVREGPRTSAGQVSPDPALFGDIEALLGPACLGTVPQQQAR